MSFLCSLCDFCRVFSTNFPTFLTSLKPYFYSQGCVYAARKEDVIKGKRILKWNMYGLYDLMVASNIV